MLKNSLNLSKDYRSVLPKPFRLREADRISSRYTMISEMAFLQPKLQIP